MTQPTNHVNPIEELYHHQLNPYQLLRLAGWEISAVKIFDKHDWYFTHAATGQIITKPKYDEFTVLGACAWFISRMDALQTKEWFK